MPGGNPADNFGRMFRTIKNLFASLDLRWHEGRWPPSHDPWRELNKDDYRHNDGAPPR